ITTTSPSISISLHDALPIYSSDAGVKLKPREFIDPRGWFRIDGLRPGSFLVAVRARGFAVWAQRVTVAPGEDTAVRALIVRGRRSDAHTSELQSRVDLVCHL